MIAKALLFLSGITIFGAALVFALILGGPAQAQVEGYPCNGTPGERVVGRAQVDQAGTMGDYCVVDQGSEQEAPARPTGWWEKTWGAIAPSPKGGVLGVSTGASSKAAAERLALTDCKTKGGKACFVDLAYHNQCAVMIVGNKFISSFSNATVTEASARGLARCRTNDTNCTVYYSACTEPIYHPN